MPETSPTARICHHCDGFATVAIDTGTRTHDGTRITLTVDCPVCHGTGTTDPRPRTAVQEVTA